MNENIKGVGKVGTEIIEALDKIQIVDYKDVNYFLYFESGMFLLSFLVGVVLGVFFWNIVIKRLG